jgi:hypothetical protein
MPFFSDPALSMRPPAALIGAAWAELSEETRPCSEREVRRLLAIWKVPSREPVVGESQQHPTGVAAPLVVQSREPAARRRRRR